MLVDNPASTKWADIFMSCQSKMQRSLDRTNVLPGLFVVLTATVANAGAAQPASECAGADSSLPAPMDGAGQRAPHPLRLDQMRGSPATANEATQSFDVKLRAKSVSVIHRQIRPEVACIARNLRA